MGAQRAGITEDDRMAGERAIAEVRRIREQIQASNPDMTPEDWDRIADELTNDVDEGLRRHVRRLRGEPSSTTT